MGQGQVNCCTVTGTASHTKISVAWACSYAHSDQALMPAKLLAAKEANHMLLSNTPCPDILPCIDMPQWYC